MRSTKVPDALANPAFITLMFSEGDRSHPKKAKQEGDDNGLERRLTLNP
jgi:hypothetical protein